MLHLMSFCAWKMYLYNPFTVSSARINHINWHLNCTLLPASPQIKWRPTAVASYFSRESITLLCEMSDSAHRVLSVAFASQCSDLTSSLCLQCGIHCLHSKLTIEKLLFSLAALRKRQSKVWMLNMNHHTDLVKWCSYFPKQLHEFFFLALSPLSIIWVFIVNYKFVESQNILFHFTAETHKSLHCSFFNEMPTCAFHLLRW